MSKIYGTGNKAIKDVSLTIDSGEFVFIVGRSSFGKGALMRLLLRELGPTKGHIMVSDMDLGRMPRRYVPKHRRRLGVAFQGFRLLKDRTVFENVTFAQGVIGIPPKIIREMVLEMLRLIRLSSKYKVHPRQLSEGERQKVAIARALINDSEAFLVDEPTGNPDSSNTHEIMRLLEEIDQRGTTVIVITHSQEMVGEMNKWIIVMKRGLVTGDMGEYYQGTTAAALESLWVCLFRRKDK